MNKTMKKYIASLSLLAALVSASCENPDYVPAEYNVRLNEANSYRVGEPVRFDISGNVDNLLFYSGETGHEYKYYNRYLVAPSDIRAAKFAMDIQCLYGYEGALDIYLSGTFDGLSGDNAEADRARIREMAESGMEGVRLSGRNPAGVVFARIRPERVCRQMFDRHSLASDTYRSGNRSGCFAADLLDQCRSRYRFRTGYEHDQHPEHRLDSGYDELPL